MPFVSVTRLRVKSIFYLFSFIRANEASVKELKSSSGLLIGKELMDKKLTARQQTKKDFSLRSVSYFVNV